MRVSLAGYNVDVAVINEAVDAGVSKDRLTPEVLSAAYARISRDPRPVGELRREALEEVEKARKSNRSIIFGMGHHSVAEHAVFNFDLLGISRLAIEELEHFRLCSFTEKSQRYITLDHDFVVPCELKGTPFEAELCSLVAEQSALYEKLNVALRERLDDLHPKLAAKKSGRRLLDSWAKEDARYVTLLCTSGQLGLTVNARNLELVVRRFAASPLAEVRELGSALYDAGAKVAPSLLLFTDPSAFDTETAQEIAGLAKEAFSHPPATSEPSSVKIVDKPFGGDRGVAAVMLASTTGRSMEECTAAVGAMEKSRLEDLFKAALRRMEFYDAPTREFEHAAVTFDLVCSASCYAQLKRHRMSSQTVCPYDPSLGLTVPPSVKEAGMEGALRSFAEKSESLYYKLMKEIPQAASYVLTNSHRRRVVMTANVRELYHFSRLREDAHAQWDIRDLACAMRTVLEKDLPLSTLLLCGKDSYVERYRKVFGEPPKVDPANL